MSEAELLATQQRYYRARAPEYDDWWYRRGRYDRGQEANAKWFAEVRQLERALETAQLHGDVLELACGTGLWTQFLVRHARRLTAVDGAPEMIALNRKRIKRLAPHGGQSPEYIEADLFAWTPPANRFDAIFFAFWLSHVPESRFERFWGDLATSLRTGGRAFFIDSDRDESSTAADHQLPAQGDPTTLRRLDDGREFRIVKRFYEPQWLESRLSDLGWRVDVRRTGSFFVYGVASPRTRS